jgi:putative transposase
MSRRLDDVRLAVLMLDGIELKGRCCVVALGITTDGVKLPLGLWDGSTENATVAKQLLSNLVARGLDLGQGVLCVIDGAKALRKAIDEVLGPVPVQRCVRHKERNVLDHLPERDRPLVQQRLRRAWARDDHQRALDELRTLAAELERSHPGAAASLREGMTETLTVTRLGIRGSLKQTLQTTNPCESMIEIVRRTSRNVKRWQSGDMCLRWTAAGMLEAERQFRKIIGYRDLAKLALAVERDLARHDHQEVLLTHARENPSPGPPPKIHGARDILSTHFGQNITRLAGMFGLTQSQLAQAVGVTPQTISLWRTGREPSTVASPFVVFERDEVSSGAGTPPFDGAGGTAAAGAKRPM